MPPLLIHTHTAEEGEYRTGFPNEHNKDRDASDIKMFQSLKKFEWKDIWPNISLPTSPPSIKTLSFSIVVKRENHGVRKGDPNHIHAVEFLLVLVGFGPQISSLRSEYQNVTLLSNFLHAACTGPFHRRSIC